MIARRRVAHRGGGEVKTKQSDALQTDVNSILARWIQTGQPPQGRAPSYGDFSDGLSYHEMHNRVLDAQAAFLDLPVEVRKHVDQDPGAFLDLVHTPEGLRELLELGLDPGWVPEDAPEPAEPGAGVEPATPSAEPAGEGDSPQ